MSIYYHQVTASFSMKPLCKFKVNFFSVETLSAIVIYSEWLPIIRVHFTVTIAWQCAKAI